MKKKIKVIHVAHSVGGVDVSIRLIIRFINFSTFEHVVVHGTNDTLKPFINGSDDIIPDYKINIKRNIGLSDVIGIFQFIQIVKRVKPDIIHCHSAKGGVFGRIAALFFKTKVVYTPQAFSYLSANKSLARSIYLTIERGLSKIGFLLACSQSELNRALDEVKYNKEKLFLFNNCIEKIELNSDQIPFQLPKEFLCTIGRPSYQKNIELMIEVLKELNKIKPSYLVILGVGHHSDRLQVVKKMIADFQLNDYVQMIEWTDRETAIKVLKLSKIYLSCARYEGLPYSLVEAISFGIPCVVSNCDGNRDVIIDNVNGFIVNEPDPSVYVDKICQLEDQTKYNKMSENATIHYENNFMIEKNISLLENIYHSILN